MYNGLIQMPNNIYRAVIYIRLSEADENLMNQKVKVLLIK